MIVEKKMCFSRKIIDVIRHVFVDGMSPGGRAGCDAAYPVGHDRLIDRVA